MPKPEKSSMLLQHIRREQPLAWSESVDPAVLIVIRGKTEKDCGSKSLYVEH